ncbi:hypothetical protein COO60DRAFT_1627408 [Scenedesmus sp. NREL 46B-D3]|nr:hypothetical protein COO60DRAFT_1627408 [Scenedesmus sp. NREL 46B-D3]
MKLPEISLLIDLATFAASQENEPPDISTCSNCLLHALVALQQLQMFHNIPEELPLQQVAAVLQPTTEQLQLAGMSASMQQQLVQLDALLGLVCLMAAGDVDAKLQLCFDTLVARHGGSSLSLPQLLAALPALKCTAAAAQLILRQDTPQSLAARESSIVAQAEWQERQQLLATVLTAAFREADSIGAGPAAGQRTAASTWAVQSNIAAASARVLVHCSVCFLLTTMVLLGDAALVAGLHAGARLPLSVSFGIAVGANLVLVVLLFAALLLVRCLNTSSDRAMSEALTGHQVQQLDELLMNISTALTLLRQSEQQPAGMQQPLALRAGGSATGAGTHTPLPRSSSSMAYRDMEAGAAGADAAAGSYAQSDRFGKMRTLWSTVGRMAGFLPPAEGLGHQESLQSPHAVSPALLLQSTFSTTSGEASPSASSLQQLQLAHQAAGSGDFSSAMGNAGSGGAAGGYRAAAARQLGGGPSERHAAAAAAAGAPAAANGYEQSRSGRALGSSGGTGSLPGISVSERRPYIHVLMHRAWPLMHLQQCPPSCVQCAANQQHGCCRTGQQMRLVHLQGQRRLQSVAAQARQHCHEPRLLHHLQRHASMCQLLQAQRCHCSCAAHRHGVLASNQLPLKGVSQGCAPGLRSTTADQRQGARRQLVAGKGTVCSACRSVRLCGPACNKAYWKAGHKQALEASCEGKSQSDRVEVDVQLLLLAKDELNQQVQLREDLQQARDEASMRPSVARKLNERIRALEGELELLRTNKKVKDLEKKVQFLSEELKQSYTTKNFTLKTGLLDLEKQYRAHMNIDPAMAAFWADGAAAGASGEVVVRQGAGFRVIRAVAPGEAAGGPGSGGGSVVEEALQPVAVLKDSYASRLQVTQSLVQHLNTNMKLAIDKADDAEADSMHVKQQLADAATTLQQLQNEQAELTRVLIDAKVEIAEKKGELMKLLRNLRRAVENPTHGGMLKELQEILATANKHAGDAAAAESLPAPSPLARSFTANLAAGVERLGQAFKDSSGRRLSLRRGVCEVSGNCLWGVHWSAASSGRLQRMKAWCCVVAVLGPCYVAAASFHVVPST